MRLVFDLTIPNSEDWDLDEDGYTMMMELFPKNTPAPNEHYGLFEVYNWNPVEILPVDLVRGHYIARFAEFHATTPPEVIPGIWELTGREVVVVGRFIREGFQVLPSGMERQ